MNLKQVSALATRWKGLHVAVQHIVIIGTVVCIASYFAALQQISVSYVEFSASQGVQEGWQNHGMQSNVVTKPFPEGRGAYRVFRSIATRWMDNDVYGHVNNVVYYSWFDTAVNAFLVEQGVLDTQNGKTIGLVVETQCNYFAPLSFPQVIQVGIRVARLGASSVRYEVGIFGDDALSAAKGHFVHVYVDKDTRRPLPLPGPLRKILETLV